MSAYALTRNFISIYPSNLVLDRKVKLFIDKYTICEENIMATKRKNTTSSKTYQRWTHTQLASTARVWYKKYCTTAKKPVWSTSNGKTTVQQCATIASNLKTVCKFLRSKTVAAIDVKLKALKTQIANRMGIAVKSSKVTSSAIKRLTAKRMQINNCTKVAKLVTLCTGLKLSSFKNPSVGRRTTGYKSQKSWVGTNTKSVTSKYKKQTKTLKKEIQKLKTRNSFMRSQVAKFRREVAQMQRHYGTLTNTTPKWKVIDSKKVGQEVSNIVRFSNALSNAIQKRKVG